MLTNAETVFARTLVSEAKMSGHPWPGYAAAEAFLESASYSSTTGQSGLAYRDKDVFGIKVPSWWGGQVDSIVTREVLNGVSRMVNAKWPVFASYADGFAARLKVLHSVSVYAEALAATTGPEFIRLVSAEWVPDNTLPEGPAHPSYQFGTTYWQFKQGRWSTAPNRASSVLATYNSHPEVFGQ